MGLTGDSPAWDEGGPMNRLSRTALVDRLLQPTDNSSITNAAMASAKGGVVEFMMIFISLYIFLYIFTNAYLHIFCMFLCIFLDYFSYKIDRLMGGGRLRHPLLIKYQLYMNKIKNIHKNMQKICKYT